METSGNTILITGGATGIGLALARRFLDAGNRVIICGRRESKLKEAQALHPGLQVRVADVGTEAGRIELVEWATKTFSDLNVLINNAGIQRYVKFQEQEPWPDVASEIAVNLEAPIHLSMLLIPHLKQQNTAAIVNVTSGLSFNPLVHAPVYSATKAALHSFTLTLRHQLADTPIKVIEIVPPALETDLGGPGLHKFGASVEDFADSVFPRIKTEVEVGFGFAEKWRQASRAELDQAFQALNSGALLSKKNDD